MPKMKTHSGAKKRFRFTGSGKLMKQQISYTYPVVVRLRPEFLHNAVRYNQ
jgi:hypothetical protein